MIASPMEREHALQPSANEARRSLFEIVLPSHIDIATSDFESVEFEFSDLQCDTR